MADMETLLLAALLGPPVLGAALALAPGKSSPAAWINAVTMPVSVIAAMTIAFRLAWGGPPVELGSIWRLDALSAVFAVLVSVVAMLGTWLGPGFHAEDARAQSEARTFRIYVNLFTTTMLVSVSTNNLGVMWVAIEASTVASALLIPLGRKRTAIEASWRYLLIGSVGIALAFTGTVLAFVDFASTGRSVEAALNWPTLLAAAPSLHPEVARLAFAFLLVGFGTKAGLAPMHTWLPDAHAEAPAPLSAMMSGVMLAVALYALARWKAVVDAALGYGFADTLLLMIGIATLVIGTVSLVRQRDYKHVLAYSSIEHTGLACFGLALGPAGIFAALLHLTGHALAKSAAFLLSGRILDRVQTHQIAGASGLLRAIPATAGLFAASILALAGLPPFALFLSEVLLVRAGWLAGHPFLTGFVLVLMLVAFGSLVHQLHRMLFGDPAAGVTLGERVTMPLMILGVPLVVLAWLGVGLPETVSMLLTRAAEVLHP
jgi:hydrogenase-4 component F